MQVPLVHLGPTEHIVHFPAADQLTYSASHPDSTVYDTCLNRLLHHAQDVQHGTGAHRIKSLDTHEDMPAFPIEGAVDVIFGGPPWYISFQAGSTILTSA